MNELTDTETGNREQKHTSNELEILLFIMS